MGTVKSDSIMLAIWITVNTHNKSLAVDLLV